MQKFLEKLTIELVDNGYVIKWVESWRNEEGKRESAKLALISSANIEDLRNAIESVFNKYKE